MSEQQKYRVSFEYVNPISFPQAYHGDRPCVATADIPEGWWRRVQRESYDLEDVEGQYRGLLSQVREGELIRNPRLEKATLTWEAL